MDIRMRVTVDQQVARAEREGWRYDGSMRTEGEVLDLIYALVCIEKPEVCVETGTYHGHGTRAIMEGLESNGKGHLWTVENDREMVYAPQDRVTYNFADSVEWSANEAPDGIDFQFIDCGEPVTRVEVARNLWPKLKPGKLMLVHDVTFYEDAFLHALEEAVEQKATMIFEALNGLAVWRKHG